MISVTGPSLQCGNRIQPGTNPSGFIRQWIREVFL